ncbi:MAG: GAF domain-containing protein [Candidatus Goldbacteria bacterium]|nr:GAF domain-containing protein [Candidatus Goldiibacteriota bacterium]
MFRKLSGFFVKFIVSIWLIPVGYLLFVLPREWWLTLVFSCNFPLIAGYVFFGPIIASVIMVGAFIINILAILKILAIGANVFPFLMSLLLFIVVFFLLKQSDDARKYNLFSAQDEIKVLEGDTAILIKEEENLIQSIKANKERLDKYNKLKDIQDGLKDHQVFSGKIRYILRNIISIFHQEKSIVLFLLKGGKFLRVEADKNEDMLIGEKDQESLYLQNFDEWVKVNKKALIISDMYKDVRFKVEEKQNIRSLISVPVFIKDELAGVLRISSYEPGCFNQEDLRFLDLVAEMIGKVLEKEMYYAQ